MSENIVEDRLSFDIVSNRSPISFIIELFEQELILKNIDNNTHAMLKENPDTAGPPSWVPLVSRRHELDRVFPMETVELKRFEREHDAEIKEARIHIGSYANEMARSMNALAITMGTDIYFRDHAYQPENEEGRKLIAHELKHVDQYGKELTTSGENREILEEEAEKAEIKEVYNSDPYIRFQAGRKIYKIRKSQRNKLVELAADYVENWLKEQKDLMSDEEYLSLLCDYEQWVNEGTL